MRGTRVKSLRKWTKAWCKANGYPYVQGVFRRAKKAYMNGILSAI